MDVHLSGHHSRKRTPKKKARKRDGETRREPPNTAPRQKKFDIALSGVSGSGGLLLPSCVFFFFFEKKKKKNGPLRLRYRTGTSARPCQHTPGSAGDTIGRSCPCPLLPRGIHPKDPEAVVVGEQSVGQRCGYSLSVRSPSIPAVAARYCTSPCACEHPDYDEAEAADLDEPVRRAPAVGADVFCDLLTLLRRGAKAARRANPEKGQAVATAPFGLKMPRSGGCSCGGSEPRRTVEQVLPDPSAAVRRCEQRSAREPKDEESKWKKAQGKPGNNRRRVTVVHIMTRMARRNRRRGHAQ